MKNCPICKSSNIKFVYKFNDGAATQNRLYDSLEEALGVKKAAFSLYCCKNCSFLFNVYSNTEKTKYSSDYNNNQDSSEYFHHYLMKTAKYLTQKYNLKNKTVVEIGCGKGSFLRLLNNLGVKNISGFDPAYVDDGSEIDKLVIKKLFNKKYIKKKIDFIICRHVLEHIRDPHSFIASISECLKSTGSLYFEFPSLEWILKNKTFFDFFYEHSNYFSKNSVIKLFNEFGFQNITFRYGLDGQYFRLEIKCGKKVPKINKTINFKKLSIDIENQIKKYNRIIDSINNFIVWGLVLKESLF